MDKKYVIFFKIPSSPNWRVVWGFQEWTRETAEAIVNFNNHISETREYTYFHYDEEQDQWC